jgi:hypothetical protein
MASFTTLTFDNNFTIQIGCDAIQPNCPKQEHTQRMEKKEP